MKLYHYDRNTGEYIGARDARPDPLEKGRFLEPRFTTRIAPSVTDRGAVPVWSEEAGDWVEVEDHRGTRVWRKADAFGFEYAKLGPIDSDLTTIEPRRGAVWDDKAGTWTQPTPPTADEKVDALLTTDGLEAALVEGLFELLNEIRPTSRKQFRAWLRAKLR